MERSQMIGRTVGLYQCKKEKVIHWNVDLIVSTIKLLEQAMKVVERVLEQRIRDQVKINNMQFGFTSDKGTTDAIYVVLRQIQQGYLDKKKLYYAFVDLEKAFDKFQGKLQDGQ